MNKSVFFFLVLLLNSSYSAFTYSTLKHSKFAFVLAALMGVAGSCLWMMMVRSLKEPNQILACGFYADLIAKTAGLAVPFLLFGLKFDVRSALGVSLMISGVLVWR